MKKVIVVLLGLAMMFGVAASASAELTAGHVNLVLYNDSNEVIYDLGWGAGDAQISGNPVGSVLIDNLDLAEFTGFSIYGSYTSIFATQGIVEPRDDGNLNPSLANSFMGAMSDVAGANDYGVVHSILDENAFMNRGNGPAYAGMNNVMVEGEGSLIGADFAAGVEQMHLYQYWQPTDTVSYYTTIDLINNNNGTADVVIGTIAPVPVPAAVWLLGSGLLGIVGLRRKNQ
jgi:hypothetical protein